MTIKTIKKKHYNLHLIKTTNFKTVLLKTVFWDKLKKEDITKRNMLIDNLLFSSENYKTVKDMSIKKEELYGLSLFGYNYRRGSYIISEINMSVIEDKYSEDNLLEESIKFYFDILNKPNIEKDRFNEESFQINYEQTKASIDQINENPINYSLKEYRKILGNEIYNYPVEGTLEDLEKITCSNLYDYYNKFKLTNNADIFIIGNISIPKITKLIDKLYNYPTQNNTMENIYLSYNKNFTEDIIPSKYTQSRLLMGGSISKLTNHEKKYESLIFNIIFGNSPNSKLFLNVREKHSYAYSISSSFSKLDGTFIINAGISKENYENTKKQVLKELNDMKKGIFKEKDIKDAKAVIIGILNEIEDYPNSILNYYFNAIYLNDDSKEKQIKEIKKITKKDIIKLANKIDIDTILLIEEGANEKNTNK